MIIPYVELNLHSRIYLRISYFGTIIDSNVTATSRVRVRKMRV